MNKETLTMFPLLRGHSSGAVLNIIKEISSALISFCSNLIKRAHWTFLTRRTKIRTGGGILFRPRSCNIVRYTRVQQESEGVVCNKRTSTELWASGCWMPKKVQKFLRNRCLAGGWPKATGY